MSEYGRTDAKQWYWVFAELLRGNSGDLKVTAQQLGVEADSLRDWLPPDEPKPEPPMHC